MTEETTFCECGAALGTEHHTGCQYRSIYSEWHHGNPEETTPQSESIEALVARLDGMTGDDGLTTAYGDDWVKSINSHSKYVMELKIAWPRISAEIKRLHGEVAHWQKDHDVRFKQVIHTVEERERLRDRVVAMESAIKTVTASEWYFSQSHDWCEATDILRSAMEQGEPSGNSG